MAFGPANFGTVGSRWGSQGIQHNTSGPADNNNSGGTGSPWDQWSNWWKQYTDYQSAQKDNPFFGLFGGGGGGGMGMGGWGGGNYGGWGGGGMGGGSPWDTPYGGGNWYGGGQGGWGGGGWGMPWGGGWGGGSNPWMDFFSKWFESMGKGGDTTGDTTKPPEVYSRGNNAVRNYIKTTGWIPRGPNDIIDKPGGGAENKN